MQVQTIGKAAREAGVNVETIRFYERQGMIEQPPRPNGKGARVYADATVARIRFIREAQQLGFALREIRELLALRANPTADCSEVRERATAKLLDVQQKIERLRRIGAALETLIVACPARGSLKACSIIDALELRSVAGQRRRTLAVTKRGARQRSGQ
ncbi:MAG: MerR family transcriptional regulator [Proteobacteria bacterium]|nr:MerR family transcriptional regulator [Pseudomonadota bacterium]